MKNRPLKGLVVVLTAAWVGGIVAGCGCNPDKMRRFDVNISLRPTLDNKRAEIDLVGMTRSERLQWQSKSATDYWQKVSDWRQTYAGRVNSEIIEENDLSRTRSVSAGDPVWNAWDNYNVLYMFIFAKTPGELFMREVTLSDCYWESGQAQFTIQLGEPSGIDVEPSPLATSRAE